MTWPMYFRRNYVMNIRELAVVNGVCQLRYCMSALQRNAVNNFC